MMVVWLPHHRARLWGRHIHSECACANPAEEELNPRRWVVGSSCGCRASPSRCATTRASVPPGWWCRKSPCWMSWRVRSPAAATCTVRAARCPTGTAMQNRIVPLGETRSRGRFATPAGFRRWRLLGYFPILYKPTDFPLHDGSQYSHVHV